MRKYRTLQIQNQENLHTSKAKANVFKNDQGLTVRGALGDINSNVQQQRVIGGKVAVAAAEFEKKAILNRATVKSNYSHVQSKVDTGLGKAAPVQPSARPALRREESTAGHARAAARNRVIFKDSKDKPAALKDSNNDKLQEPKKISKQPALKEYRETQAVNPIIKLSLGKLKLDDAIDKCDFGHLDICDIDAGDNNSPLLMSTYVKDIYKYLTELEEKYPIEIDSLRKQLVITGKMRATLISWLVDVHLQFSLLLETFHLTVGIIDRYLQEVPNVQKNELQLIGVTAMFIASKYEEIYAPDVADFVYVTDNAYTQQDVFRCERDILTKLNFCLARPIPLQFLRRYVKAAGGTSRNHHLAKYFVDLCLIEYTMAHYRPSELAAAAVCTSLYLLSRKKLEDVWTPTLQYYSGYSLEHIKPIIEKIARIISNVDNCKYKSVFKKYSDPSLAKVSCLPELKSEAFYDLFM
ncbi:hypothetical protein PYW07_007100 [Mythimna separata]|uniref:Cyclin B n=1 Tax=Mythimna separata TaxID=271217 RepID=A0AAD7Z287_MYTSE|nr:hypothetical protein PYW07_007100 [Mythimna separata]